MTRRCRGCGHVLRLPSPDGLGPVCRARLAGTPTPRTIPSAPAAGQLPLEDTMPKNPNAHLPHDRRAVEPDGTVHAARFCPGGFTTACAVYPAPQAAELVAAPIRAVTCTACQTELATAKEDTMPLINPVGAHQAATIRDQAAQLGELDNLRDTSALREVLLDLSYALASLPIGTLIDAWSETGVDTDVELPDPDVLREQAARLRHCADNT